MGHTSHSIKLGVLLGMLVTLGLSSALFAQSKIETINDGVGLTAYAHDVNEVLSINIRIVGPDGFVFEDRVEDTVIDWVPETELPNGLYQWEVWTVTAAPGAPVREVSENIVRDAPQASTQKNRDGDVAGKGEMPHIEQIPVERYIAPEHKNVHTTHGTFRAEGGALKEMNDEMDTPLSQTHKPNTAQRLIGAVLDFLVPSAHAQTVINDDFHIDKIDPRIDFLQQTTGEDSWYIRSSTSALRIASSSGGQAVRIADGAPTDALGIGSTGNIGLGTSAPSTSLHVRRTSPRIRLQDTDDAQTWTIRNTNQGVYEVTEDTTLTGSVGPFAIEPNSLPNTVRLSWNQFCTTTSGVPICSQVSPRVGINVDDPASNLHIRNTAGLFGTALDAVIRLDSSSGNTTRILGGSAFRVDGANSNAFRVEGAAPSNALRVNGDGNVGVGTASPLSDVHVKSPGRTAMLIDAGPNEQADFTFRDDGDARWVFRMRGNTQNFEIARRAADGSAVDSPLTILESDGRTILRNGLQIVSAGTPNTPFDGGTLFVDSSDGDLKVRFDNGTVKTIATN